MIGVDTNVLVRYLVADDRAQSALAARLIEQAHHRGEQVWVSLVTVCELVWVLESAYGASRGEVANTLAEMVRAGFLFEREEIVRGAIAHLQAGGTADFSDYVIGGLGAAAGVSTNYTFDRKLGREPGFTLLR